MNIDDQNTITHRAALVKAFISSLYEHLDDTVQAIVADGWPEAMVRRGLELHRRTWNVDAILAALELELSGFGGLAALDGFSAPTQNAMELRFRAFKPGKVIHIWPALPGAGLTPVLIGWLLGITQVVRPSSRGTYFAEYLQRVSREVMRPHVQELELVFGSMDSAWRDADAVLVSGSDDTLNTLHEFLGRPAHRKSPVMIGYGHRVSFALIVDDGSDQAMAQAALCAQDAVMWHQQGCFSARSVIFCGPRSRGVEFATRLGDAIAFYEAQWGAQSLDPALLASRAQAKGMAELIGTAYGDGIGWAQMVNTPWRGQQISPHVLSVHTTTELERVPDLVQVPVTQLQGAALYAPRSMQRICAEKLATLGVTRICKPGMLQSPGPGWTHDGQPNILDLLRFTQYEL